ncbi:MAG: response regulator, partial [Acidobacteria bacterium]|nr:response regulator [Acidobacteriota bacterium]MDW7985122.1 response regulator [Acidobacteriota bacterium]
MAESRGLVFVLDDEPDIVEALTEVLEDEGYACRSARDPLTALAQLEQEEPDAVLLDLRLPQMDGREV